MVERTGPASALVFYEKSEPTDHGTTTVERFYGLKAEKRGRYYQWLGDLNKFSAEALPVPPGFRRRRRPAAGWIAKFVMDPRAHRIRRQMVPRLPKERVFFTHDNGARPFAVYVHPTKVRVYRMPRHAAVWTEDYSNDNDMDNLELYTHLVLELERPRKVWVGDEDGEDPGNSFLIHHQRNVYYYVGEQVYHFTSPEPVRTYDSVVGNSDVPYPFALSRHWVFFLLERVMVPRGALHEDNYDGLYEDNHHTPRSPLADLTVVEARAALD